jgi:hypothetical protein
MGMNARTNLRMEADEMERAKDRQIKDGIAMAERDFEAERYSIENNIFALEGYIRSMNCAIEKARSGSDCEKMYFVEKMEKMANRLGYDLVRKV